MIELVWPSERGHRENVADLSQRKDTEKDEGRRTTPHWGQSKPKAKVDSRSWRE